MSIIECDIGGPKGNRNFKRVPGDGKRQYLFEFEERP